MEGAQRNSAISPSSGGESERRWLEGVVELDDLPEGLEVLLGERAESWGVPDERDQVIKRHQNIFALYRSL